MRLEKLHLVNFKNYEQCELDLKGTIHCLLGKNGSGKTNLLEAIHYLSFTKGSLHTNDLSNVRHGADQFLIEGILDNEGKKVTVSCSFAGERKKTIRENGKEYARFSEHIGKYPLVLVAPNDIELIWDGGEVRRKFFDALLSQVDKVYLGNLITYQTNLKQRNSALRMFADHGDIDRDLISLYDEKMALSAEVIYQKRSEFMKGFEPILKERYDFLLAGFSEAAGLTYESELSTIDFRKELSLRLDRDMSLGRTTTGIHRDDFPFTLNGKELKKFGSQGQQKSYLIALKLAEFEFLKTRTGIKPLILLDDIFDKLDDQRIHQLMKLVTDKTFGQIFITDARPGRSLDVLREAGVKSQNFIVEDGTLQPQK